MLRRKPGREEASAEVEPKGFDDYEVKLGDTMRGERATLGKSLLDVQRELRIKAAYIAAIENCDASVFESPGFVAGYVRSYARYLKMDPEVSYERFCAESGFSVSRGLSSDEQAKTTGAKPKAKKQSRHSSDDLFERAKTPFIPAPSSALSGVAPEAVGSSMILLSVIGLIAFGGWTVLKEIQKVSISPVEQAPQIAMSVGPEFDFAQSNVRDETDMPVPSAEAFDRLYRPQALDIPVITARDEPIASLDPSKLGMFASPEFETDIVIADLSETVSEDVASLVMEEQTGSAEVTVADAETPDPIVVEDSAPEIAVLAVQPAWVRVRSADGNVIFEKILSAGEEYVLPQLEGAPTLRAGNSGSVYFKVGTKVYGPAGGAGGVAKNVALSSDNLTASYAQADPAADNDLAQYLNVAQAN